MSKTMSDKRLLTILLGALLGICMVLSIGIQNVYADNYDYDDPTEYTADLYGDFSLTANDWGGLEIDDVDSEYLYVIVDKNGMNLRLDFAYDFTDETFYLYDEAGKNYDCWFECDDYYGYINGYNKVNLVIMDDMTDWDATATKDDVLVHNDVVSIDYQTSSTSVYSEDIKANDGDGETYLNLDKRSIHTHDGETWRSAYAVGDRLTIHYSNDRSKTFIDKDYYDEDQEEWTDGFFCGTELLEKYIVSMDFEQKEPKAGNNIVWVYYHGRRTAINLNLETPESRAAEAKAKAEAEAKAKAEAEAKAKAEAEARAKASNINKGTVTATDIKKASALGVTTVTLGPKVKKLKKNAFKGAKITTIVVKTKKLKKGSVKGSLKGSKVKTVKVQIGSKKVNKKFVKKYKKIFTKKIAGKKVRVK